MPNGVSRIQENAIMAVLLKYLSHFWQSTETALIYRKVELKLK